MTHTHTETRLGLVPTHGRLFYYIEVFPVCKCS